MEDITKLKISNVEKERLLIKNLNNRPNAMATYGQAKMSPAETKEVFDKQFELAVERHNNLCDKVENLDETVTGFLDGTEDEEHKRRIAEMERQGRENQRTAAEKSRENDEQIRQENERVRIDNERSRETTELARIEAEIARKEAESERETAEESRGNQFGNVAEAVQRIQEIQQDIDEEKLDTLLGPIAHMEGGWYNGTGTGTNSLAFMFEPRVVLIIENVMSEDHIHFESLGVIFPKSKSILKFESCDDEYVIATVNDDEVELSSTQTSLQLTTPVAGSEEKIFNVKSINDHDEVVINNSDGYGYWYYAFG